jgi:hypothetical protein
MSTCNRLAYHRDAGDGAVDVGGMADNSTATVVPGLLAGLPGGRSAHWYRHVVGAGDGDGDGLAIDAAMHITVAMKLCVTVSPAPGPAWREGRCPERRSTVTGSSPSVVFNDYSR